MTISYKFLIRVTGEIFMHYFIVSIVYQVIKNKFIHSIEFSNVIK